MKSSKLRTALVWTMLLLLILLISFQVSSQPQEVSPAVLMSRLVADQVLNYSIRGDKIEFRVNNTSQRFVCRIPYSNPELTNMLLESLKRTSQVAVQNGWSNSDSYVWWGLILIGILFVSVVIFLLLIRRVGGGQNNVFAMRNSQAKLVEEESKVKFDEIGGCEEAKQELSDLVSFLRSPERWTEAGARLPRGILLEGPPGCGKTLLARAVAGETNAKFYYTAASEFVEMFVGIGAARVRDMFETARKNAPAVLFIDEIDAIGRRRGSGTGTINEEREQTLNQLLVCIDGFQANDRVVVIGATNRSDILDKALTRTGRFDRRIVIPALTPESRRTVLEIHTRQMPLGNDVQLEEIARRSDGLTGADLEGVANSAALLAVRRMMGSDARLTIDQQDFLAALEKRDSRRLTFDALDAVLFESTTQLAEPIARAVVRMILDNGTQVEGEVVWVDPHFIKVRRSTDQSNCIVPKHQISVMEALQGTAQLEKDAVQVDRGAASHQSIA